jgi:hypothetical protein
MTLAELVENPAIKIYWREVRRPILEYLTTKMIETARGSECVESKAQAEAAANKAIADLIAAFDSIGDDKAAAPARPSMPPLKRFSADKTNTQSHQP